MSLQAEIQPLNSGLFFWADMSASQMCESVYFDIRVIACYSLSPPRVSFPRLLHYRLPYHVISFSCVDHFRRGGA